MNKPTGGYLAESYTVYRNGSFLASDGAGNSFGWRRIGGLPAGVVAPTLRANSTAAVQNFVVTAGGSTTAANVSVIYSTRYQYCQPAGLEITIEGTVHWSSGTGTISLPFTKPPAKVLARRAWFGNITGVALGVDWSGSTSYNPSFVSQANAVTYAVGTNFLIDPTVVGSSTVQKSLDLAGEGRVFYANGYWWVFYFDGANYGYRTSTNGTSWSSETSITTSGAKSTNCASFFLSGLTVYRAVLSDCSGGGGALSFYYDTGTISSNSITWGTESAVSLTGYAGASPDPVIAVDASSNVWLFASYCDTSGCPQGSHYYGECTKSLVRALGPLL